MNRADIEQAVREELARGTRYYHASKVPHRPGDVLEARCPRKSHISEDIERFIDDRRPAGENSRLCSMYSVKESGGPEETKMARLAKTTALLRTLAPGHKYVYEVEPLGHVTAADFAWVPGVASGYYRAYDEDLREPDPEMLAATDAAARNYFTSQCRDTPADDPLEWYYSRERTPRCDAPDEPEHLSPALRIKGLAGGWYQP